MKNTLIRHLESALVTFIAMFFTLVGTALTTQDPVQLTKTVLWSLVITAIRGAFKATYESFAGSNDLPIDKPVV